MRVAVGLCFVTVLLGVAEAGGTGWRSDGTGHYPGAKPPVTFSPTENMVWATPLPSWSNASPVLLEDRIIVCAEPDLLIAVDKSTGKILWQRANPVGEASGGEGQAAEEGPKTHDHNGYTSATPVSDGERVFAVFGNGVVCARDLDGKRLWSRFVERPVHKWGHSTSPVLAGGRLIVHFETLCALDPVDGQEVWRQPEETWVEQRNKQWGTPLPARIGETGVVITTSGRVLRAFDGEILFRDLGRVIYSTPTLHDGVVYFFCERKGRAVRLPPSLDGAPELLWETETVKERYYGSPLIHEGLVYVITRKGHFSAFDAVSGQEVFQEKLLLATTEKEKNAAYTSVTLAGELLYFAGMDGSVMVVKPGRAYQQVARNQVETSLRSTPVFEGTRMYLRAPGHLYCFGS